MPRKMQRTGADIFKVTRSVSRTPLRTPDKFAAKPESINEIDSTNSYNTLTGLDKDKMQEPFK